MHKIILVDASGLIYRGFYAVPPFLKSPAGVLTNAVFGFANILFTILTTQKPDYLAVAYDKRGPTFRHKAFEAYKATRVKAPQELYDQIPIVKNLVATFGIPGFEADGFEADDVLATMIKKLKEQSDLQILVATGDFDMFQVVSPNVWILYPTKGFREAEIFKPEQVKEKYGLLPEQVPDYKGLAGDSSDNIPGVRGIGDKGATSLLQKYGNLENIYAHVDEVKGALQKKLIDGKEDAFMCKKLATLEANVPFDFNLDECRVKNFDVRNVRQLFGELGFKSLQRKLDELFGATKEVETKNVAVPVDLEAAKETQGSLF